MKRLFFIAMLLAPLAHPAPARALRVAAPSQVAQFAQAEVVVVGKIVGFEEKEVITNIHPSNPTTVPFKIATIEVSEGLLGKPGKTIRLGFQAPAKVNNGGGVLIVGGGFNRTNFTTGQEGAFFFKKHHAHDFYTTVSYAGFEPKQSANFDKTVAELRKIGKLTENPVAALKGADKVLAATYLLTKYRQVPGPNAKLEPIPAEESKLILKAIADADWKAPYGVTHPYGLFNQLNLTPADGYKRPVNIRMIQEIYPSAQTWLRENQDKFVIKRYVP